MALKGSDESKPFEQQGREALGVLNEVRRVYADLSEDQKKLVQQRKAEADELEHQAELLKISGGEQREINKLQQQALELRRQAAAASGKESEALRYARQQELASAREVAEARRKADAEANAGVQKFKAGLSAVKSHWMEITAAVYTVVAAIKAVDDAMYRAFQQRAIFQNLPYNIGEVRTATMGLIGDLELARIAVESNRFEVARSERALAQLAEAGTKLGLSVGKDAASAVADLNLALARSSPLILDNLGIQLKLSEATRLWAQEVGVAESMLNEEQRAVAFREIGMRKAIEAANKVNISLNEQEQAWIGARQQWDKLIRETIPELTKKSTGMWKGLQQGGQLAEKMLPLLGVAINRLAAVFKPVAAVIGFFAKQIAWIGKAVDAAGVLFDAAKAKVGEFFGGMRNWLADSFVGEAARWVKDTAASVVNFADNAIDKLTDSVEEQIPQVGKLREAWISAKNVFDTDKLKDTPEMIAAFEKIRDIQSDTAQTIEAHKQKVKTLDAAKVSVLERQAALAEFDVKMGEAQNLSAEELEGLYRLQYVAKLKVLQATGKQLEAEQLMRDEMVRQTQLANKKSSGGRGPTDADRMRAAGEIMLEQWRLRLRMMEAEAKLRGATEAEAMRFAGIAHNIAIEELRLEQQVLEVTRVKSSVERAKNEARKAAIDEEIKLLDAQKLAEDKAKQAEETAKWIQEGFEWQRATIEAAANDDGRVISMERHRQAAAARRVQEARDLEAARSNLWFFESSEIQQIDLAAAAAESAHTARLQQIDSEAEAAQIEFDKRAALLALEDPQTEAERAAWRDESRQLEHDREMQRIDDEDARKQAFAEVDRIRAENEIKRRKAVFAHAVKMTEAGNTLMQKGADVASLIMSEVIKDEDQRAKAELRARGIAAMGIGALETVKAVAAFADLNIPQGILHSAAAGMAFAQGVIMLSGRVPGEHGGGASAAASAGGGGGGGRDRTTSAAPTVPDSVPAPSNRGPRRIGGPGPQTMQGGVNFTIQGDVYGNVDDDFAEKLAIKLRDVGYGNEAAA